MRGRIIPTVLGEGWRFAGAAHVLVFGRCLGTVMVLLGVLFSLLTEDHGPVEVDLSAVLGPWDSNWFALCPRAM